MVTYDFTGKSAFVTGGSAGMGESTVRAFAEAGAAVAIVDRDGEAAEKLAAELTTAGHRAIAIACDVSDEAQVEAAVERTVEEFGGLDMAFNNAGIMLPPVDSAEETAEAFDKIVAVNLKGVWASMKYELGQMGKQGSGSIVNCSSLGGLVGGDGRTTYHATKHGDRPDQERRAAVRQARGSGQCGLPRHHRDADGRADDRRRRARSRRRGRRDPDGPPGPRRRDRCRRAVAVQ